jgi:hypothetical protein
MPYFLTFWSNRSTASVIAASTNGQARRRAQARRKTGYGSILSVRQANADDSRLIRRGVWVRRRRDGTSPQFGSAAQKSAARRQRSRYRSWL